VGESAMRLLREPRNHARRQAGTRSTIEVAVYELRLDRGPPLPTLGSAREGGILTCEYHHHLERIPRQEAKVDYGVSEASGLNA
jgi:hypothetical protein